MGKKKTDLIKKRASVSKQAFPDKKTAKVIPQQKKPPELRKRAEEELKSQTITLKVMSDKETQQLIHELQVHQMELEMQNDELRKAQAELEESRTRYSDLYDFAPVGYFTFDKHGLILEANLTAAKELGIERSRFINKPFRTYIVTEDREIFNSHLQKVFKSDARQTCEIRLKIKNGIEFYAQLESIAANDLKENTLCRTSVSDITERKRAEEKIRASEERFRIIFDNANDGILLADAESKTFYFANVTICRMLGYSQEEIKNLGVLDIHLEKDFAYVIEQFEKLSRKVMKVVQDLPVKRKDGSVFYADVNSTLVEISGKHYLLGIFRDITERRKYEEKIRVLEGRVKHIVDHSHVGVFESNTKGELLFINEPLLRILEFESREDLNLRGGAYVLYKNPKDREKLLDLIIEKGQVDDYELEFVTKTGRPIHILVSMRMENDILSGTVVVITERKKAEKLIIDALAFNKTIFRASPIGIITFKASGQCVSANEALASMVGTTVDQLLTQNFRHLESWKTSGMLGVAEETLTTGTEKSMDFHVFTTFGKEVWFAGRFVPFQFEDEPHLLALFTDITERKKAEDLMETLRHHSELILNSAAEGIIGLDSQGNQTFVNPSAAGMLGYEAEELIGKRSHPIWHHSMDDKSTYPEDECPIYATLKDGSVHYNVRDEVFWRKDGTSFPVAYSSNPIMDEGKIIGAVVNFRDITERKNAEEQIKRQVDYLAALRDIDRAITSSFDLRLTLKVVLGEVANQLRVDAADVLLFNHHLQTLEYAAGLGFRTTALQHTRLPFGKGHAGQAVIEQRIIHIPNLHEAPGHLIRAPLFADEEFVSYYAAPLITKGQIKGVLEIFHRSLYEADAEWLDFLDALATQTAIAIDNAGLFNSLQRSNIDLIMAYDATIEGWAHALDYRDKETEGHSRRVTEMTVTIAKAIGISDAELVHVRRGALLHDIGKMGIPDSILLKPGKLTDEEWEIMRKHPVYAYELLSPIDFLRPALDIPYCHHEKWDGTGYPRGLKGEQIPLPARIFSVVDVWDALCSDRPYRPAWPKEKVREYIQQQTGKDFDPRVTEVFFKVLSEGENSDQ